MTEVRLYSAAGNRFAVLDAFESVPEDPAALARELCARYDLDGLLLGLRPREGGDCRMGVVNRDGSRAEACGNGLRALARWAVESGHAAAELSIETDAGPRHVRCELSGGEVTAARAEMGVPRVVARDVALAVAGLEVRVDRLDLGNPHCVVLVPDVGRERVRELGPALEGHAAFAPTRVNVSFVQVEAPGALRVRTWERGVGETGACGTGACASAVAAILRGVARSPVEVAMPGGVLRVEWGGPGESEALHLAGPVEALRPA